jgi:Protein of unknown function (DUF3667)
MEYNCSNCDQTIAEYFCSNCGQKKYKRIDKKYIWDEIQYTLIHTNKGFLYTIKSIIKNAGKTAREFIDGNRVNHYKPISLVFILSGISAYISYKIIGMDTIMKEYYSNQKMSSDLMNDYMSFVSSYNSIIMLLLIPLFAIFTKLAFRKWGQNYYEHIVMNAFGLSTYMIIYILILYPILFIIRENASLFVKTSTMSILITPFIMIWFYKNFYTDRSLKDIVLRVLLIILMTFVFYIALIIGTMVLYLIVNGPEGLKYLQPK